MSGRAASGETVVRRSGRGWVVGDEEASDLTSAMVLADLLAADLASPGPTAPSPASPDPTVQGHTVQGEAAGTDEAARLAVTVSQLEHALTARVRVEQAIGVLAERHRLRSRDAFDLLRSAARNRGRRVLDIAEDVVNSTTNSLLRLPEELERKPEPRARIRSARRSRRAD